MAEGNGIDLGSTYGLLLEVAQTVSRHDAMPLTVQDEMRQMRAEMATNSELAAGLAAVSSNMATKADLASLQANVGTLRQTVAEYHSSVLGHGVLISERDDRVRRIERHLDLPQFTPR